MKHPEPPMDTTPEARALREAKHILSLHDRPALAKALAEVTGHFQALQTRSQLLISLVTIALTITGFSGPTMARSGVTVAVLLAMGLLLVLSAALVLILGILTLKWVTAPPIGDDVTALAAILRRRDQKTRLFTVGLALLSAGLTAYTLAVVFFLLLSGPPHP